MLLLPTDEKSNYNGLCVFLMGVCLCLGPWKEWSLARQQEVTQSISVWSTVRATPVHLSTAPTWALEVGSSLRIVDSHCRSERSERGFAIVCMWGRERWLTPSGNISGFDPLATNLGPDLWRQWDRKIWVLMFITVLFSWNPFFLLTESRCLLLSAS